MSGSLDISRVTMLSIKSQFTPLPLVNTSEQMILPVKAMDLLIARNSTNSLVLGFVILAFNLAIWLGKVRAFLYPPMRQLPIFCKGRFRTLGKVRMSAQSRWSKSVGSARSAALNCFTDCAE